MKFQSKNTLYSFIFKINRFVRYILLLIFLIIIFAIWSFFMKKLENEQRKLIDEINLLQKKHNLLLNTKSEILKDYFEINDVNNSIHKIVQNYFKNNPENCIDLLLKNSKLADLIILDCNSETLYDHPLYEKSIFNFNFKGTFEQITNFFNNLASTKHWLKIIKLKLMSNQENEIIVEGVYKFYIPKKGFMWSKKELFI